MRYRRLGNTNISVSEIGLGCGFLGCPTNFDSSTLFSRALDFGINVYDTGDVYGDSEARLGDAFSARRERVVLVSKFGSIVGEGGELRKDWSITHMREALVRSLRRLRTDYLDVYLLHSPPPEILERYELRDALLDLKRAGMIRAFGLSLYGVDFFRAAVRLWQPDVVQIHYNLFSQRSAAVFPQALAAGIGVMARRPLDAGMLGGELLPDRPLKLGDPRPRWGVEATERRQRLLLELQFLTEGTGRNWAQAALAFTLSSDAVSTVIPSTTSLAHLEENVAAAGVRLTPEELRRIAGLIDGRFADLDLGY
jgi:aryl-alcohol dehydrogenase-like predicted oxidoreductase